MSSGHAQQNPFLTAPIGRLFITNALPMMLVMMMSGLLTVVDAAILGHFIGADALAAVSIVFPAVMVTIALSTLVSGGMSSLLARHLGAGARDMAAAVFARAHGLALMMALVLIFAFLVGGRTATGHIAGTEGNIAEMSYRYLLIMICATPVQFLLGLHADACRNEGRVGLMALMSVGVTFANIAFNYVLIVELDLGIAGSALGTALAQALGLALLVGMRLHGVWMIPLASLGAHSWAGGWRPIVLLGMPLSLSFIGIALVAAAVIATLRLTAGASYADTAAAYGIVMRIFSFTFLPLMAIALSTQSIVGNNVGAGFYQRSDRMLRLAVSVAFFYCVAVELILLSASSRIGAGFAQDASVVAEVGAILRPMVSLYLFTGPILVFALYFQAAGQPGRAAVLTLVKPFALSPLLIVCFGVFGDSTAIWFAFPVTDCLVATLATAILIPILKTPAPAGGFGLRVQRITV